MSDKDLNVLDPSIILHSTSKVADKFNSPQDALAAASHAIMLAVGFRFTGLGDDARQEGDGTIKKLPENWNSNGPHCYNFRYSHPQSSLTFVIKIARLGERCIILGIGIGDNKTAMLDISTEDYTSESFYPYETTSDQPLVHGFISSNRFNDFIKAYKLNIIQRLIPGLNKPGYEDNTQTQSNNNNNNNSNSNNNRPTSPNYPSPNTNVRPPPGIGSFEDPNFPDVGSNDLNPLGNLRLPGTGGGSGMYVGPNHPLFGGGGSHSNDHIFGGPQPLPRGSIPPGARFDPIAPFGNIPTRPPGRGGIGRGGRGFYSGDPDNDELPPPGYGDMFG